MSGAARRADRPNWFGGSGRAPCRAVDPSAPFVAAIEERYPEVASQRASAEALPFTDDTFAAALAQLVVQFMDDPVAGLREMARVTRPGGVVAACLWDHAGGKGPLSLFWETAHEVDPRVEDESHRAGVREGSLATLFAEAGLRELEETTLSVSVAASDLRRLVGAVCARRRPGRNYVAGLDPERRERLRDACRERLPDGAVRDLGPRLGGSRRRLSNHGTRAGEQDPLSSSQKPHDGTRESDSDCARCRSRVPSCGFWLEDSGSCSPARVP